jgi:hypothetical protein
MTKTITLLYRLLKAQYVYLKVKYTHKWLCRKHGSTCCLCHRPVDKFYAKPKTKSVERLRLCGFHAEEFDDWSIGQRMAQ